ncbi:MAG: hypothetical protein ACXVJO_16675 [Thermoanaerobaculia bacterium]
MHVVLIDDDEDLRVAMRLALKSNGIISDSYADCDVAMAALVGSDARPDAILLVTAAHDAATLTREMGANGYLAKPFDVGSLLQRVSALVRRD